MFINKIEFKWKQKLHCFIFLKQFYIHGICVPVESSDQSKGDKEKLVFYLKIGEEL